MIALRETENNSSPERGNFDFSFFVSVNSGTFSIKKDPYSQENRGFEQHNQGEQFLTVEIFFNGTNKEILYAVLVECIDRVLNKDDSVGVLITQKDPAYPKPRQGYGVIFEASTDAWEQIQSFFVTELIEAKTNLEAFGVLNI